MRAGFVSRRIFLLLLIALFLYLSLYTWNLRYGYLDRLSEITGLEIAGFVLRPGNWVADEASTRWRRYVHLVDVEQENERLREAIARMALDMARLREDSAKAKRLEHSLEFNPPEQWKRQGARVIAHRLGPTGSLETFLVDKGTEDGIYEDAPAITADGAVGRILRVSPNNSTVLLLSDPNSRIPVLGCDSRTTGVLMGQGQGELLRVNYVPLNEPINEGEILVSSGLARVFPKGIPVARVVTVERSDISLFKTVLAESLVDVRNLEEVLLLTRLPIPEPEPGQAAAPVVPSGHVVAPVIGKTGVAGAVRPQSGKPAETQAQKPAPGQLQTPRKQTEQARPAAQERTVPAVKTAKPQAAQTPVLPGVQTQTPPVVQTQKPGEGQASKPQAPQAQTSPVPQVQNPSSAKPAEQRMTQNRMPVPEAISAPQAANPQTQTQAVSAQSAPAQTSQGLAAPVPVVREAEAPVRATRNAQSSASPQQPGSTVDQPATPTTQAAPAPEAQTQGAARQAAPAQSSEPAPRPGVQSDGSTSQSTWPPALQSAPVPSPTRAQPAPADQAEPPAVQP